MVDKKVNNTRYGCENDLAIINDCIKIAFKNNGGVFGGFNRDVVIPLMVNPELSTLDFKDVDLWFKNVEDSNNFLEEMGDKLVKVIMEKEHNPKYPFARDQYKIIKNNQFFIIDVVVLEKIPVNDFNVNCLVLEADGFHSYHSDTVEKLIDDIKNKTIFLLREYALFLKQLYQPEAPLKHENLECKRSIHINRIRSFNEKYTICFDNGTIKKLYPPLFTLKKSDILKLVKTFYG